MCAQISSPGLQLATRYMLEQAKAIQAEAATNKALDVQVRSCCCLTVYIALLSTAPPAGRRLIR
jgi:hypothetical protein